MSFSTHISTKRLCVVDPCHLRNVVLPTVSQNGIPIANAVANVAFNKANKVVSFGSSFVKPCASCMLFHRIIC